MKKNLLTSIASIVSIFAFAQTTLTYNYTGAVQSFTVPPCVSSVTIQTYGAQGADTSPGGTGGLGGYATGVLSVVPGDVLNIYVGGINGYNGGGAGGANGNPAFGFGGVGGGASDVRLNGTAVANRVVVAGGGGGAGSNGTWPSCQVAGPAGNGGSGGGLTGSSGTFGVGTPCNCAGGGGDGATGGSQVAGGIHGGYAGNTACLRSNWTAGQDGTLAQGGAGSTIYYNGTGGGGGGGGGYYGGGSGGSGSDTTPGGGGGGGSSYTGTLTSASTSSGSRTGDGMVVITYSNSGSVPASPTSISGNNSVCTGTTGITYTISSVVGATSYTWAVPAGSTITSGQGTVSITVSAGSTSGTVSVTANNACGSSSPTTLAISINPLPTVSISPSSPSVCMGSSVGLTASGASTYSWSSGGNAAVETVSPTTLTSYTVTEIDINGCVNTASVTVMVNALPTISATASSTVVCSGISDTLMASGASTYSWSSGGNAAMEIVSSASSTTYTVTGTDLNGCSNTTTISVSVNPNPTVTATASSNPICVGSSTILTGGGATSYLWQPLNSSGSSVTDSPNGTTTYTLTGTDNNGCINSATVTVTVNPLPTITTSVTTTPICVGSSTNIVASGGITYVWQPGGMTNATESVFPTSSTTYTVTGTDANGCSNFATVDVSVNQLPILTVSASNLSPCASDGLVALTSSPTGGTWSGTAVTGSNFNPATAGTGAHVLTYTYTDPNTGCSNSMTVTITVNVCTGILEQNVENGISVFPNPNSGDFTLSIDENMGDIQIIIMDETGRVVYSSSEKNVSTGFTKQINLGNAATGTYLVKISSNKTQKVEQLYIVR